jgi:hypothetical protein
MKFEVTHPKIWKKLAEKNMPMKNKIQIYEKLGGAYRLGESDGEQVFNKMTELLKHKISEETTYKKTKKSVKYSTLTPELKSTVSDVDFDVEEPVVSEEDHEVGMAMNQLDDIIKNATELKGKVGQKEMNLPGWIQDHISQSQNFINQANTGFHKLDGE